MTKTSNKNGIDGPPLAVVETPEAERVELADTAEPEEVTIYEDDKPVVKSSRLRTFFQNVERIEKADWGTRAYITVYRLEPVIDRTRSTENKFVEQYQEAIDLQRLKRDQGSGKYELYLSFKAPAAKASKELDVLVVEVFDLKYPPELPLTEWVDSPKNKKWAWAKAILEKREAERKRLEAEDEARKNQVGGGMNATQVLQLVDTIEDRVAKRYEQKQPAAITTVDGTTQLTALVSAAQKIAELKQPPPTAPATANPELAALRQDLVYYRDRADKQTDELIKALSAKKEGSGIETFTAVVKQITDFLPQVKNLLPSPAETEAASRMTGSQEFWQGLINTGIDKFSPLISGLVQFMVTRAATQAAAQQPPAPPAPVALPRPATGPVFMPGHPNPQAPPPAAEPQPLMPIVEQAASMPAPAEMAGMLQIVGQSVATALVQGKDGAEYAENFAGLFGDAAYDQLAALPKERLLQIFQSMPMWNQLGLLQQKVPQFIEEFIAWGTEAPEPTNNEGEGE